MGDQQASPLPRKKKPGFDRLQSLRTALFRSHLPEPPKDKKQQAVDAAPAKPMSSSPLAKEDASTAASHTNELPVVHGQEKPKSNLSKVKAQADANNESSASLSRSQASERDCGPAKATNKPKQEDQDPAYWEPDSDDEATDDELDVDELVRYASRKSKS